MVWDLQFLCDKADYAIIRYAINRIRLYKRTFDSIKYDTKHKQMVCFFDQRCSFLCARSAEK